MPPDSVLRVGFIGSCASAGLAERLAGWAKVSVEVCQLDATPDVIRNSPAQLALRSDILITHFEDEETAAAVMLDPDGVLTHARVGLVVIELSPVSPGFLVELAARFEAAASKVYGAAMQSHQAYVDTALLEHDDAASLIQRIEPRIRSTGDIGSSKAMAIVERLLACVNATVAEEAVALGARAGIPMEILVPLLLKGSGGNEALRRWGTRDLRNETPHRAETLRFLERDLALAGQLGRYHSHSVLFGALALATCRGAAGASDESKDMVRNARHSLHILRDGATVKRAVTAC